MIGGRKYNTVGPAPEIVVSPLVSGVFLVTVVRRRIVYRVFTVDATETEQTKKKKKKSKAEKYNRYWMFL